MYCKKNLLLKLILKGRKYYILFLICCHVLLVKNILFVHMLKLCNFKREYIISISHVMTKISLTLITIIIYFTEIITIIICFTELEKQLKLKMRKKNLVNILPWKILYILYIIF